MIYVIAFFLCSILLFSIFNTMLNYKVSCFLEGIYTELLEMRYSE